MADELLDERDAPLRDRSQVLERRVVGGELGLAALRPGRAGRIPRRTRRTWRIAGRAGRIAGRAGRIPGRAGRRAVRAAVAHNIASSPGSRVTRMLFDWMRASATPCMPSKYS